MLRNILCAAFLMVATFTFVMADVAGQLVGIDGNKITVKTKEGEKTLEAAADVKVVKMDKKNKVEVAGGLKADELKKGAAVKLIETGGKVSEIVVGGGKKK